MAWTKTKYVVNVVTSTKEDDEHVRYRVRKAKGSYTFFARISGTQNMRADVEGDIERYFQLFPNELPATDGEVVDVDLNKVRIE
jgi:hypothetical protein